VICFIVVVNFWGVVFFFILLINFFFLFCGPSSPQWPALCYKIVNWRNKCCFCRVFVFANKWIWLSFLLCNTRVWLNNCQPLPIEWRSLLSSACKFFFNWSIACNIDFIDQLWIFFPVEWRWRTTAWSGFRTLATRGSSRSSPYSTSVSESKYAFFSLLKG